MSEVALQAVGLVRRLDGAVSHTLVNGIDLSVNKGEFLAITGPSGSGKSSLLYLLGLLDAPSDGEVIICGQPTSKLSEDMYRSLQLEFQGDKNAKIKSDQIDLQSAAQPQELVVGQ